MDPLLNEDDLNRLSEPELRHHAAAWAAEAQRLAATARTHGHRLLRTIEYHAGGELWWWDDELEPIELARFARMCLGNTAHAFKAGAP